MGRILPLGLPVGKPLFPIFAVVIVFLTYWSFDRLVIHCEGKPFFEQCSPVNPSGALDPDVQPVYPKTGDLEAAIHKASSDLSAYVASKTQQDGTEAEPDLKKDPKFLRLEGVLNDLTSRLSSRLTNRYVWVMTASIYFLICVLAIIVSAYIIFKTENVVTRRWLYRTAMVAFAIFLVTLLAPYLYMEIRQAAFEKTVLGVDGLPPKLLYLVNSLGFAASIFLVGTVAAILSGVEDAENPKKATADVPVQASGSVKEKAAGKDAKVAKGGDPATENIEASSNGDRSANGLPLKYEIFLNHLKYVLYLGSAILILQVVMLRTVADWHLSFLSTPTTGIRDLVAEFFASSTTFQAGLYAVMLAAIYLPAAWLIQDKAAALRSEGLATTEQLREKGLSFNFWEFLPRLLVIAGPFLAAPISKLAESLSKW